LKEVKAFNAGAPAGRSQAAASPGAGELRQRTGTGFGLSLQFCVEGF